MRTITTQHLRTALNERRLMTINEIAELLGVTRQAVQQRIGRGDLPVSIGRVGNVVNGVLVWDREEVLDYVSKWDRR
jgi:predicted DNA-binding transcriptional regulator AlpA